MTPLEIALGVALIVTLGALPVGLFRMAAYRSGDIDHTRTMFIAAWFALGLGLVGLVCTIVLALALLL
ncbi:hypothetical protein [Nocardioides sp. SYSU DS0663]|uniref:hypothetical protein n=1 Tax=Nocardioides sp. SYSU DS0663 TaxID=3416445 RepID=UPI003F4C6274